MEPDIILSLISIASTIAVGFILRHRIKSQEKIIQGLNAYVSVLDINKIREYDSYREESILLKAKHETEDAIRNHITSDAMIESFSRYVQKNNQDLFLFCFDQILKYPEHQWDAIIETQFSINKPILKKMISDHRNNP